MLALTSILFVWVSGLVLWICVKKLRHGPLPPEAPPGRFGWPLLGETLQFVWDGNRYMAERLQKYGPVFTTHLLGKPMVVVCGADNVRTILKGEGTLVANQLPPSACALMGEGALSTTHGERHRTKHRVYQRMFSHSNLQAYTPVVQSIVRSFFPKWCQARQILAVEECRLLSFTLALKLLLGFDLNSYDVAAIRQDFLDIDNGFFSFAVDLPGFAFHKAMNAKRRILRLLDERHIIRAEDQQVPFLLDQLIAENQANTATCGDANYSKTDTMAAVPKEVKNAALELMFGSYESVGSAMCATIMHLHENPDVIEKILQEVNGKTGQRPSHGETSSTTCHGEMGHSAMNRPCISDIESEDEADIGFEDLVSFQYVNDVIKEVLRVSPPLAGAFRRALKPVQLMKYIVPEGWSMLYTIKTTHGLSPMPGEDVHKFDPERWQRLRQNASEDHVKSATPSGGASCSNKAESSARYQYIPFGGGLRNCVGKEFAKLVIRVFLVEFTLRCRWKMPNGVPAIKTSPIPFPVDRLPLEVSRR